MYDHHPPFQCRDIRHRHKLSEVQKITQYYIMWGIKWKQWNRDRRYSYVGWKNFWDHDNLQGQRSKFGICENYSWEWMSKDLFRPRFKRKNTENKMSGKWYVDPPSISWKRCFTTQNMKMSRVNFLSSSFLLNFFYCKTFYDIYFFVYTKVTFDVSNLSFTEIIECMNFHFFSSRMRNIDWRDFELIHGHEKIYVDMRENKIQDTYIFYWRSIYKCIDF